MVRKVVSRAPHREVGQVHAGWLLTHPVEHESHLERRFIFLALACPVVVDIAYQEPEIQLSDGGHYTPDFLITLRSGEQVVVEVKPSRFVPQHAEKLAEVKAICLSQGRRFLIATDSEIDGNGRGVRAILLARYARHPFNQGAAEEALKVVNEKFGGQVRVMELSASGVAETLVWAMVSRHQLVISSELNVNPNEAVSARQPEGDCIDYFFKWIGAAQRGTNSSI